MLKLSTLLRHSSRDSFSSKRMLGSAANDFTSLRGIASLAGMSSVAGAKVFAPYSIFKGKAALSADPLLPKFAKSQSGGYKVERRGVIMLTLWPSIGERKYDWERRQKFALSATEVGSLINLGPKDSCEFFHDPSILSSNAGQVRKSLSVKAHADGSGYFVSLTVVNSVQQTNDRLVVPVTAAEFAVMRTAFAFALPHIMGWDQLLLPSVGISTCYTDSNQGLAKPPSSEWDR